MRIVDIIQKKRDNNELTDEEIEYLLQSYLCGDTPDYQMAAFCMAVYFNGMSAKELTKFTMSMCSSGDQISFPELDRFFIDKHSTGGVGDKTTLVLSPVLSCFNIVTAKLSGRGLGHTGGTIDKLESIPGFVFPETREGLLDLIELCDIGIMGYSDTIVPLDKKLYALRDVTATIASIPLIASSIMSKKLAIDSNAIILDVKCGSGAFMKNYKDAMLLAETMVAIGKNAGRKVEAVISNMQQPLGNAIGNSLELIEAIETLEGKGPDDFKELITVLGTRALMLKGTAENEVEGRLLIEGAIESGDALRAFESFIRSCHGDIRILSETHRLPMAENVEEIYAKTNGQVAEIDAAMIGHAAMLLGAGRATKEEAIDHGVGIVLNKKVGSVVKKGEVIASLYYNKQESLHNARLETNDAFKITDQNVEKLPIILNTIKSM